MSRVLLVEDDRKISEITQMYLAHAGFAVTSVFRAHQAQDELEQAVYSLIIFDVMLPDGDGFELLRALRAGNFFLSAQSTPSDTPVLMLTALGQTEHVVKGFGVGADDYVSKPFEPAELVARVTAILKRTGQAPTGQSLLRMGELQIELTMRTVTCRGVEIVLNRREYDLLLFFCRNMQKVYAREQLITHIWGLEFDGSDRSVDVCVQRVRGKLKKYKTNLEIKTVWGIGYMMEELKS